MKSRLVKEPGMSRMVAFSLLFHVAIFGIMYRVSSLVFPHAPEQQAYYVDVVNLPVANPRSGTPSAPEKDATAASPQQHQEMKLPTPAGKKAEASPATAPTKKTTKEVPSGEADEDFNKRLTRLEQKAESRHESAALEAIRNRISAGGRAGMPGAKGNESGSDYASYIQSRLRDAFRETIAFQSRNPEVIIKLRISRFGKVIGYRTEQSSRDKLFEASVSRAISIAGEHIPPPPGGTDFEQGFVFRPQGVGKK
jgi:colicin import membrane protein